jgi:hypothetical protein
MVVPIETLNEEDAKIRGVLDEALNEKARPSEIIKYDFAFSEDSTGDASVWIWLVVPHNPKPPRAQITRLRKFADTIRDRLLSAHLSHWPYVQYTSSSDRLAK